MAVRCGLGQWLHLPLLFQVREIVAGSSLCPGSAEGCHLIGRLKETENRVKKSTFGENGKIAVRSSKRQPSRAAEQSTQQGPMFTVSLLQDPALKALTLGGVSFAVPSPLHPVRKRGSFGSCVSVHRFRFTLFG